jgi:hypothetical protein
MARIELSEPLVIVIDGLDEAGIASKREEMLDAQA